MSNDKLRKAVQCVRCGHTWFPRKPGRPMYCPKKGCPAPYYWDKLPVKKKAKDMYGVTK